MARAKNRGYQETFTPSYTVRRWKLGGYIRLSKEDLKKAKEGKDDSNSVKNQRDLLNDYHQRHIDEFESISEYVDDGHTGTDTDRENFQRLLADVMSGKINCVVVKDLSRLSRNYSDARSLIEIFPCKWASALSALRKTWTASKTRTAWVIRVIAQLGDMPMALNPRKRSLWTASKCFRCALPHVVLNRGISW